MSDRNRQEQFRRQVLAGGVTRTFADESSLVTFMTEKYSAVFDAIEEMKAELRPHVDKELSIAYQKIKLRDCVYFIQIAMSGLGKTHAIDVYMREKNLQLWDNRAVAGLDRPNGEFTADESEAIKDALYARVGFFFERGE